jgi:hypothetical protein
MVDIKIVLNVLRHDVKHGRWRWEVVALARSSSSPLGKPRYSNAWATLRPNVVAILVLRILYVGQGRQQHSGKVWPRHTRHIVSSSQIFRNTPLF